QAVAVAILGHGCLKREQRAWQRSCSEQSREARTFGGDPMKAGLRQRLARIETEPRTAARSGGFRGLASIDPALPARGDEEAPHVFANRWTQCEVDRLCLQARLGAAQSARTTAC